MLVLALALVVAVTRLAWTGERAAYVEVRLSGELIHKFPLSVDRQVPIQGTLGLSVVEVNQGRVRVQADPGPRQYCVRQGWLDQAGQIALCLPNQVSVMLVGSSKPYDSLNY